MKGPFEGYPPFSRFCHELLLALATFDAQAAGDVADLEELAVVNNLTFEPGWVRKAYDGFTSNGWINGPRLISDDVDGGQMAFLTGPGLSEAERLGFRPPVKVNPETTSAARTLAPSPSPEALSGPAIPASDRVVRLDDNAPGRSEAIGHLETLITELKSNRNDLPLSAEERSVSASELEPFVARLRNKWLRVGELYAAVTKGSVLVWMSDKLAGAALVGVVGLAITSLWLLIRTL